MNPLNRILNIILPLLFVAAGIFVIFTGVDKVIKVRNNAYTPTTAVVDHLELIRSDDPQKSDTYNVYVRYTVDGKEYLELLDEGSDDMKHGDKIDVLYETAHPERVTMPGTGTAYVRIAIGAVAILIGIIAFLRGLAAR